MRKGAVAQAVSPRRPRPGSDDGSVQRARLGTLLAEALGWHAAHADFDRAIAGLPARLRGRRPAGLPYSPWELVEHLRLAQRDILEYCRSPRYVAHTWPDEYWPRSEAPATPGAWRASLAAVRRDRRALAALAQNRRIDVFAGVPNGVEHSYLRELLLILDHNAYHVGQLVTVCRLLGAWREK